MSGRSKIDKYKFVLKIALISSFLIPKGIFKFILAALDNSESNIALLVRFLYIKKYSANAGNNIFIGRNVVLKNVDKLVLGDNISIHAFCYLDAFGGITLGDNVSIANHTSIISTQHTWEDLNKAIKYNPITLHPINIADDVWIGSGCRVLGGVDISKHSILAAGAVLTKSMDSNSIYAGVPAKKIKVIK